AGPPLNRYGEDCCHQSVGFGPSSKTSPNVCTVPWGQTTPGPIRVVPYRFPSESNIMPSTGCPRTTPQSGLPLKRLKSCSVHGPLVDGESSKTVPILSGNSSE